VKLQASFDESFARTANKSSTTPPSFIRLNSECMFSDMHDTDARTVLGSFHALRLFNLSLLRNSRTVFIQRAFTHYSHHVTMIFHNAYFPYIMQYANTIYGGHQDVNLSESTNIVTTFSGVACTVKNI